MNPTQNRRDFLKLTAISTASLLLTGCAGTRRAGSRRKKPNIVLIFLDDSGWSDFHPFGNPDYPTPNVRRLAAEGCRFNNFYVP